MRATIAHADEFAMDKRVSPSFAYGHLVVGRRYPIGGWKRREKRKTGRISHWRRLGNALSRERTPRRRAKHDRSDRRAGVPTNFVRGVGDRGPHRLRLWGGGAVSTFEATAPSQPRRLQVAMKRSPSRSASLTCRWDVAAICFYRMENWSRRPDLNRRPTDYESVALPTELRRPWEGCSRHARSGPLRGER